MWGWSIRMCTGIMWSKALWKIPMVFVASRQTYKRRSVGKRGGGACDGTNGCDSWNGPLLPTGRRNITSTKVSNHNRVHLISWARWIFFLMAFHKPLIAPWVLTIIPQKGQPPCPAGQRKHQGLCLLQPDWRGGSWEDDMLIQGKQRKTEGERCETWSI